MNRKIIGISSLVLITVAFIMMIPGTWQHAFKIGAGKTYSEELKRLGLSVEQPIPNEVRQSLISVAYRVGIIYAILSLLGFNLPIFMLLFLLIAYSFGLTDRYSSKLVIGFVVGIILFGVTCFPLSLLQLGKSLEASVYATIGIWTLACFFLGGVFSVVWLIKRLWHRKKLRPLS